MLFPPQNWQKIIRVGGLPVILVLGTKCDIIK
ncbi:hypothetical protein mphiCDS_0072 [Staphylococcus phage mosaic phi11]